MKLEEFSQDDFERASKRLVRSLTRGKTSSSQPKAILLGGQSGAGKTTIHRVKQREFQGNIIIIDGDSYRSFHPNYLDGIVEHLVDNLRELENDKIFNQIQIYQRDQSCVCDSEIDQISAAEVLQECLFGKWSKVEEEMLKLGQERLRELGKIDK